MASKKNTAVKMKANVRTGRPAYLSPRPKCEWIMLRPKHGHHRPVKAWAYRTEHGWTGWLEQFCRGEPGTRQVIPTNWSNEAWAEIDAHGVASSDVEVNVVSVGTKKGKR